MCCTNTQLMQRGLERTIQELACAPCCRFVPVQFEEVLISVSCLIQPSSNFMLLLRISTSIQRCTYRWQTQLTVLRSHSQIRQILFRICRINATWRKFLTGVVVGVRECLSCSNSFEGTIPDATAYGRCMFVQH